MQTSVILFQKNKMIGIEASNEMDEESQGQVGFNNNLDYQEIESKDSPFLT